MAAEPPIMQDSLASEDLEIIEALKKRLKNIRSKTSHQLPKKEESAAKELSPDKINEIEIVIDQMFQKKESASKQKRVESEEKESVDVKDVSNSLQ